MASEVYLLFLNLGHITGGSIAKSSTTLGPQMPRKFFSGFSGVGGAILSGTAGGDFYYISCQR